MVRSASPHEASMETNSRTGACRRRGGGEEEERERKRGAGREERRWRGREKVCRNKEKNQLKHLVDFSERYKKQTKKQTNNCRTAVNKQKMTGN